MEIFKPGRGNRDFEASASASEGLILNGQQEEAHIVFLTLEHFIKNRELFGLPSKAVSEVLDARQIPNIEFYEKLLFLTINNIAVAEPSGELTSTEINLFFSRTLLAVIYHGNLLELGSARARMDMSSVNRALYTFLDALLDNNKRIINRISDAAENLEDEILQRVKVEDTGKTRSRAVFSDSDKYMNRIVALRKQVHFLKGFIEPTQDIIEILEVQPWITSGETSYYQKLSLKGDRLIHQLSSLNHTIAEVRASWQAQVDVSFNKIVKLFTVITAVFAPLNLIAGWFGMNFVAMPGLAHPLGYPVLVVIAVLILILSLWWFRRNDYL